MFLLYFSYKETVVSRSCLNCEREKALNVLQAGWRTITEDNLQKIQEGCVREFRLC